MILISLSPFDNNAKDSIFGKINSGNAKTYGNQNNRRVY
jgi:hypothetical protein